MFLYPVLYVFRKRNVLYVYYIVINNIIYNNKNEDCIGKKDFFSRKVTLLWRKNANFSPLQQEKKTFSLESQRHFLSLILYMFPEANHVFKKAS
jgi:hypothetical protein